MPAVVAPLLALAIFSPVLGYKLLWDDTIILERQLPALTPASCFSPPPGLDRWSYAYYRPLSVLSLFVDHRLYGADPRGYHATVWWLHALTALAVYLLARRLVPPPAAALAASLFAVFPLHAEPVGWISGRTDVLATLFAVLAATLYLRAMSPGAWAERARPALLAGGAVLFLAALLSKESAIALAPAMAAMAWLSGRRDRAAAVRPPFVADPFTRRSTHGSVEDPRAGACEVPATLAGLSLTATMAAIAVPIAAALALRIFLNPPALLAGPSPGAAARAAAFLWSGAYLPRRLAFPFLGSPYLTDSPHRILPALASASLVLAGILVAVRALRRGRNDVLFALLWTGSALGAIAAAASWSVTRTPVADRNLYLAAAGWALLLATLLAAREPGSGLVSREGRRAGVREASAARRRSGVDRYRVPALVAGWLLVILFAAGTWIRLPTYAGNEAFWSAVTKADPLTAEAHLNLGNALAQRGDFAGAERAYRTALALPLRESDRPLALSALGAALDMSGRSVEAETLFRHAASLTRAGPTEHYSAGLFFYRRADARSQKGDRAGSLQDALEGIEYLERAIRRDPRFAEAWLILGNCEALAGKREEARSAWRRVLELGGPKGPFAQEAREALSTPP